MSTDDTFCELTMLFSRVVDSMFLCTMLLNDKPSSEAAYENYADEIRRAMAVWLDDYGTKYDNPLQDLDLFFRRCVRQTQKETELLLAANQPHKVH